MGNDGGECDGSLLKSCQKQRSDDGSLAEGISRSVGKKSSTPSSRSLLVMPNHDQLTKLCFYEFIEPAGRKAFDTDSGRSH